MHLLHHVERDAEHVLVVAHRQHLRHPHRRVLERAQEARLAQHVVRGRRQRRARRAPQHDARVAPRDQERDVRVALADPLHLDAPVADPVRVEELLERLAHHERRQLEAGGVPGCVDHVHRGRESYVAAQASTRNQPWRPSRVAHQLHPQPGRHVVVPVRRHEPHVELAQAHVAGEHLDQVRGHVPAVRRVHELPPAEVAQGRLVQPDQRAERLVRGPYGAVGADHGARPVLLERRVHGPRFDPGWHGSPITRAA